MKTYVQVNFQKSDGYTFIKSLTWTDGRVFHVSFSKGLGTIDVDGKSYYCHEIHIGKQIRRVFEDDGKWFVITTT